MIDESMTAFSRYQGSNSMRSYWASSKKSWIVLPLLTVVSLSACQPKAEENANNAQISTVDNSEELRTDVNEITPMSDEVRAHIDSFEAEFVNRMLNLQQSQLAEYNALQAADAPNQDMQNNATNASGTISDGVQPSDNAQNTGNQNSVSAQASSSQESQSTNPPANDSVEGPSEDIYHSVSANSNQSALNNTDQSTDQPSLTAKQNNEEATKSAMVEEVKLDSLQQLPLINIAIQPPEELTAMEISSRYNVALQSLYLEDDVPLPAKAVDTLLNIATLTPNVFRNQELATHLVTKSPALARMLKQYQIWEQIELEQSAELEAIKQAQIKAQQKQTAEFNALVEDFNTKIKGYDEQIKKYEQKLQQLQ